MNSYTFTPKFTRLGDVFQSNEFQPTADQIKNEPMFFSCGMKYLQDNGGPITRFILNQLAEIVPEDMVHSLRRSIIDTRSHMLMPGFYPCIPGWHHDDVPRSRRDGQSNYDSPEYKSQHLMVVIGETAFPQFLKVPTVMPKIPEGLTVYKAWDTIINSSHTSDDFYTVGNGDIYHFDWQTFHRGMPAQKFGWRWFIRFSWDTQRPVLNEIRNQVQVYLSDINQGW